MATDWKHTLIRIATAIGSALLFLARHLLALLVATTRFIALRALPATWRWLRGTVFPALHRFYLWLPHRRVVVATGLLAIAIGGLLMFKGMPGSVSEHQPGQDTPVQVAKREAGLVDQLLSDDWQAQKDATRSVLESIGVTVLDDDTSLPAGNGLHVVQPELLMLAMDGARKSTTSRITLAELAQMLKDIGFPFPEGRRPAEVMEEGIRAWVGEALENPGTPGAEAARFLHAMAARQDPAIDLSSSRWMAEQYGLTHLELFVFNATIIDVFPDGKQAATSAWLAPANLVADMVFPRAHAAEGRSAACSVLLDLYGEFYIYDGSKKNMQNIFGLGESVGGASEGPAKGLAKAAGAISTLFKLHRLMLLYTSTEMRVTADQPFVHKPATGEAGKEVTFVATVGIDEEKQREFERKMKESSIMRGLTKCLAELGLPTPTDVGDIAKEMENWKVSWNLYGDHATWSNKKNKFKSGNLRQAPLEPSADGAHGESRFVVDIKREEHHEGDIITDYISGKATLHTDVMPGTEAVSAYAAAINSFKNGNELAGLLGLTGVTVGLTGGLMSEVLGGWAQRILDPEVSYNVAVAYHRLRHPGYSYEGEVNVQLNYIEQKSENDVASWDSLHGPGSHNLKRERYNQYTSKTNAGSLAPTRASFTRYTDYKHRAVWRLSGQANSAASYEFYQSTIGETGCAGNRSGAYQGKRSLNRQEWGSGSNSGATTYSMTIDQEALDKHNVRIHLQFGGTGRLVPYQRNLAVKKGGGCEFLNRGEPVTFAESEWTVGPPGGPLVEQGFHVYTVSEPFPERISGSTTRTSDDGKTTTTWKWNLHRVGPFEDPDAKSGTAGRG